MSERSPSRISRGIDAESIRTRLRVVLACSNARPWTAPIWLTRPSAGDTSLRAAIGRAPALSARVKKALKLG